MCEEGDVHSTAPRNTPTRLDASSTGVGMRVCGSTGFSIVAMRMASFTTAMSTRPAERFATISSPGVSCLCPEAAYGEKKRRKIGHQAPQIAAKESKVPQRDRRIE